MVQENIAFAWDDGMSIHFPPELPVKLEEEIYSLAPGFEVLKNDDDVTLIRSKSKRVSIISDSEVIKALCIGTYGDNLESIRTIGNAIKQIALFSKRNDVSKKLEEVTCDAVITYDDIPIRIVKSESFVYHIPGSYIIKEIIDHTIEWKEDDKIKTEKPIVSILPEKDLTKIVCSTKFHNFLRRYENQISNMFDFTKPIRKAFYI